MSKSEFLILAIGFGGQTLFFMRFLVQWICSERVGRSMIPLSFWYFSIAGSALLLIYAIIRRDIVFIVGQSTGFFIYIRNIYLVFRENKLKATNGGLAG